MSLFVQEVAMAHLQVCQNEMIGPKTQRRHTDAASETGSQRLDLEQGFARGWRVPGLIEGRLGGGPAFE